MILFDFLLKNGRLWEKYNHKRIYLPHSFINMMAGYEIETYNSGNISQAKYKGEKISNKKAKNNCAGSIEDFYYDAKEDKFYHKFNGSQSYVFEDAIKNIRFKYEN